MGDIVEQKLSYIVNGCIFDVHNEVGPGLREECYQKAMELRLAQAGIDFTSKPHTRRALIHLGEVVHVFEPDFVIANRMVLELKALAEGLGAACFRQAINYLKSWSLELGLLANFADASAVIQRVLFKEVHTAPREDFEAISGTIAGTTHDKLVQVRDSILAVHQEFGLGYSDEMYRKLIAVDLLKRGLNCQTNLIAVPSFRDQQLPICPITPLLIDDSVLIHVEAVRDGISARSIRTMQTYLQVTSAAVGIVACFGQREFEVRGIRPARCPRGDPPNPHAD